MRQASDVRRLLSRLKMEDFKYREFAEPGEVRDATAAWPALYEAAIATGAARVVQSTAPAGDAAAKRRIVRDRATLASDNTEPRLPAEPAARVDRITAGQDAAVEASEREGERLGAALAQRLAAGRSGQSSPTVAQSPPAAPSDTAETTFEAATIGEGRQGAPRSDRDHRGPAQTALRTLPTAPSAGRGTPDGVGDPPGLFLGGVYCGSSSLWRDEAAPAGGRGDNALRAVFARLSRGRDDDDRTAGAGRLPGRLR